MMSDSPPRYSIRTFDDAGLRQISRELMALANREGAYDLLIGVRSGGYVVAEAMLPIALGARLLPITLRRPSSVRKSRLGPLKQLLKLLPRLINDRLRLIEHRMLTHAKMPQPVTFTPDEAELSALKAFLTAKEKESGLRILIIDDAVDSGATLLAVTDLVRALAPDALIRSAAVTVTTPNPLIEPDYSLHRLVLCRFPWALDA